MRKKNFFSVALSCSLIWHLLGMQAVSIVWPAKIIEQKFSEINFWGAIVESAGSRNPPFVFENTSKGIKEKNRMGGKKIPGLALKALNIQKKNHCL